MAKRGFFAELQYQNQQAEKRRQQAQRQAAANTARIKRETDAENRRMDRESKQFEKAQIQEQKRLEKEAAQAYLDSKLNEVEDLNEEASKNVLEIEGILAAAMDVDSWVDLEQFRVQADHPPFGSAHLEVPIPAPAPVQPPPEPVFTPVPAPSGLGGMFGGKKKHEQAVAEAQAAYAEEHAKWREHVANVPTVQLQQMQEHQAAEATRTAQLAEARASYEAECAERELQVATTNKELDALIAGVGAGTKEGIEEYVSLVLGTSGYPSAFPVEHEVSFDPIMRELTIQVTIPGPEDIATEREYKYNKTKDEITSTNHTQKALKDLYTSALHQVALRALHEVFEADRGHKIQTIAMTVGSNTIDPATGKPEPTKLLAVAADRSTYEEFDLSNVVPLATLQHLNAVVSKNPYGRVAIDDSRGVRGGK